jgi:glyoxylate reductase
VLRILVTRRLPQGSLDPIVAAGHSVVSRPDDRPFAHNELAAQVASVDGVVCLLTDRIDRAIMEAAAGHVRVVANVAVGYDNIDLVAAKEAGIAVCNTPGVLDETTADLAFLLILAASRLSSDAERDLRAGQWPGWNVNQYLGRDVHGATLGIVGWGRLGQAVSRRAQAFNMRILHHSRRPTGVDGYVADLDDLLSEADIVSLHVPLTEETHHLIDWRRLKLMKSTSVLVNTARGPVVDESALAQALHEGEIFGAGIDVFEREPLVDPRLLEAPRAVLLPHIGSGSVQTRTAMGRLAAQSVVDVLAGHTPPTLISL